MSDLAGNTKDTSSHDAVINELQFDISNEMACVPTGESDQSGQLDLIRAFIDLLMGKISWLSLTSRKQVRVTNTPLHPTFI